MARSASTAPGAPEFRLICLALRPTPSAEDRAALRAAVAAFPDWRVVLYGARRHAIAPVLLPALKRHADIVPRQVIAELHEQALAGAAQSLRQIAELRRLAELFADAGIRMLTLKGVVLSVQLYGDAGPRMPGDIDLLIDPERADDADALLIDTGYTRRVPALSPRQRIVYRRRFREITYDHPISGELDVHHRLSDYPSFTPWPFDVLWREREEVAVAGSPLATLPRRCLGLYLCVHGAEHVWDRLRWLVDLALLLRKPGEAAAALAAADGVGFGTAMLHALQLAHDWLGLDVAAGDLARARAEPRVARLDRVLSRSYAAGAWHGAVPRGSFAALWRYSVLLRLYRYSLQPNWRYRVDCLRAELISMGDWQAWRLPDALFWVYPVIRPFGWLVRRLLRL